MKILNIKETLQCGDNWLLHFICPNCNNKTLSGYPMSTCGDCNYNLKLNPLDFSKATKRIEAGTFRKRKGGLTKKLVLQILEEQNKKCAYCSLDLNDSYCVEHIIPLAVGGSNNISNLVLACNKCNLIAGSLYFNDFQAKRCYILNKRHKNQQN